MKPLEVAPMMALPPLCAFTRRTGLAAPGVVRVFVEELKRASVRAGPPRTGR